MKILVLHKDWPFPVNTGHRLRTWNFIQAWGAEHRLSLLCIDHDSEAQTLPMVERYFTAHRVVAPVKKKQQSAIAVRWRGLLNALAGMPWEIGNTFNPDFAAELIDFIKAEAFDVIFARYLDMGKYLIRYRHLIAATTIIDLDDIEFIRAARQLGVEPRDSGYDSCRKRINNWLYKHYYYRLHCIDCCTVCSGEDAAVLKDMGIRSTFAVIPNAIEVAKFQGVGQFSAAVQQRKTILFCGLLTYVANEDAIRWFVREIFPLILASDPAVRLMIVGMYPTPEINSYHNGASIIVQANVPSLLPYYEQCSLVVAPIRIAGGTRIKILEALAGGRPVVATAIGAEGLGLTDREQYLQADTAVDFARRCLELMYDFPLAAKLTAQGYDLVNRQYDQKAIAPLIRQLLPASPFAAR